MGHGVGLQVTEPPSIMPTDKTILKENMIIAIEPSLEYAPGVMLVQEENILITNNGCEILTSRTPIKMPNPIPRRPAKKTLTLLLGLECLSGISGGSKTTT